MVRPGDNPSLESPKGREMACASEQRLESVERLGLTRRLWMQLRPPMRAVEMLLAHQLFAGPSKPVAANVSPGVPGRPEELHFQWVTATLAAPYGGVGRRRGRAIYSLLVRPLNRERRNPKPEDSLGRMPIQVDVLARTRTCGRAGSTVARGQASPIRCAVAARVSALTKPPTGHRAEGDQEVLLFILQIAVGAAAWFLIASLFAHRLLGETFGFFGLWVAMFPFARRTWAANIPGWRYWAAAVTATVVGAGLRLVLQ